MIVSVFLWVQKSAEMKLYLCEKPSQGEDISKFLGMSPVNKKHGYYQSGDVAVTWARGHLFKLQPPEHYAPELKKKWRFDQLPVVPEAYQYALNVKSKAQWRVIKELLKQAKIVYIATDPDPEGECIARNLLKFAAYKGDVLRILYGSTDKKTLTKAFANPLKIRETEWMYHIAQARSMADWVVGMNLTMAVTLVVQKLESSASHKKAFPVGRVKIPAAMLVYLREQAIKNFKSVHYYEVEVAIYTQSGDQLTVSCEIPEHRLVDGRLLDRGYAEKIVAYIKAQNTGVIHSLTTEDKRQQPPLPFDLTSLQSMCDQYNIDPDETLEIAQSLYDKPNSATSYPRTDTPYLTSGLADDITETVSHLIKLDTFSSIADQLDLKRRTQAWNDQKVKVHYGIIPTVTELNVSRLTDKQKAVYLMVAQRYLIQFMPDYVYKNIHVRIKFGHVTCQTVCHIPQSFGWRSIEASDDQAISPELPALEHGSQVSVKNVRIIEKTTRKPARYTQSSLASAMVNMSSEIGDVELKKLLSDKDGIGTVATRPAIIKDLIKSGLLLEEKRQLKPSRWFEKYMIYVPKQIKEPVNSALWERGFQAIKAGQISIDQFVKFQEKFVRDAVIELYQIFSEIK